MRVHVVAPEGFADPGRPSGGNVYDRRVCDGLTALGWDVRIATVARAWPAPDRTIRTDLARVLSAIPDGETVLIDGLIASPYADPVLTHTRRLRMFVLLHMPLVTESERAVLAAVDGVVVTSEWTRRVVLDRYGLPPGRVHIARPGTDPAAVAPRNRAAPVNGHLLCVAALARHKGQDVLVEALAGLAEADWECVLAGPLDREPEYVAELRAHAADLGGRIIFTGTLTGTALDRAYASADLLVVPSRAETYGMVVTEALARAVPVIATTAGGLPEALGHAPPDRRLVPPDDPIALRTALEAWLGDASYRRRLRAAALHRRPALTNWDRTAHDVAAALTEPGPPR